MIGYCAVAADILHIGHIRFIEKCKALCSYLIVGIMTDKCIQQYKGKLPVMDEWDRLRIIENLKPVDKVMFQDTFEYNLEELKNIYRVEVIFDSVEHRRSGADVYLPFTEGISSTLIKEKIRNESPDHS